MWALLLVLIVVLFVLRKTREHFGLVVGTKDWWTTDTTTEEGREIFSMYPNTCTLPKTDFQLGLCYERCKPGFYGVGPICWAKTENVGVGKPIGLEPCPKGWANDGLTCRQPLKCESGLKFFTKGCEGGKITGRLDSGGVCDWPEDRNALPGHLKETQERKDARGRKIRVVVATHPDRVDGLCYKRCPRELPKRVPGMPYLCYKGDGLSYSRGVGSIPPPLRIGRTWGFPWSNY
jgi:hypothetical protein